MNLKYISDGKYKNVNQVLNEEFKISSKLRTKLILNRLVLLNDSVCDTRQQIVLNDKVEIKLDYEEENSNIIPTEMDLEILYEDDYFIIINKPAGIAVHPSILHYNDSLSNGLKFYFDKIGLKKKIRPVNRLDLNTSGLVLFAKNEYIQEYFIKNKIDKTYLCLCEGFLEDKKRNN